jgi:hypothetical protein
VRNDLSVVLISFSLVIAAWSIALAVLDRRAGDWMIYALGVLELLLMAQLGVAITEVAQGKHPASTVTFLAYAAGALLIAPAALFWSLAEKSRSSTLVITVACLALPVMTVRMLQMWSDVRG